MLISTINPEKEWRFVVDGLPSADHICLHSKSGKTSVQIEHDNDKGICCVKCKGRINGYNSGFDYNLTCRLSAREFRAAFGRSAPATEHPQFRRTTDASHEDEEESVFLGVPGPLGGRQAFRIILTNEIWEALIPIMKITAPDL